MAEPGGLNQEHKGARQEQGGRREAGGGAGEEVRFRNLRNQELGTGAVGGEEVRFRNVKMRQKRARPSAGRPKSEVSLSLSYLPNTHPDNFVNPVNSANPTNPVHSVKMSDQECSLAIPSDLQTYNTAIISSPS